MESDKCVFCGVDLETWSYEYESYVENERRASPEHNLNICKDCAIMLNKVLKIIDNKDGKQ